MRTLSPNLRCGDESCVAPIATQPKAKHHENRRFVLDERLESVRHKAIEKKDLKATIVLQKCSD